MRRELNEFSNLIDEHFEPVGADLHTSEPWTAVLNWFSNAVQPAKKTDVKIQTYVNSRGELVSNERSF